MKRTGPLLTEETKAKRGEKEEGKEGKGDGGRKGIRDGAEGKTYEVGVHHRDGI